MGVNPTQSRSEYHLAYLDKTSYSMGEEITFEVKIQNTGREAIEMPWTSHLGDLDRLFSLPPNRKEF